MSQLSRAAQQAAAARRDAERAATALEAIIGHVERWQTAHAPAIRAVSGDVQADVNALKARLLEIRRKFGG